jgi:hypothetical protein
MNMPTSLSRTSERHARVLRQVDASIAAMSRWRLLRASGAPAAPGAAPEGRVKTPNRFCPTPRAMVFSNGRTLTIGGPNMPRQLSAGRRAEQLTPADAPRDPTDPGASADSRRESAQPGEWPADAIERRPLDTLVPYARNARLHSDAQIAQIAASMREWGWTAPVLVSESGTIIAGHGRVLAARKLGIATVPVVVARGWSDEKIRAYVIADNRLAENAAWDREMLGTELASLQSMFDLSLTGFSSGEIEALCVTELPDLGVEYNEHAADAVKLVTCPACGHQFPK